MMKETLQPTTCESVSGCPSWDIFRWTSSDACKFLFHVTAQEYLANLVCIVALYRSAPIIVFTNTTNPYELSIKLHSSFHRAVLCISVFKNAFCKEHYTSTLEVLFRKWSLGVIRWNCLFPVKWKTNLHQRTNISTTSSARIIWLWAQIAKRWVYMSSDDWPHLRVWHFAPYNLTLAPLHS